MKRLSLASLALLCLSPALAEADALVPGTEAAFNLPGRSLAPELYIDVPEGAGALRIELESATPDRDLDLVVRSNTPFQVGPTPDPDALFDQAQYRSSSAGDEEFVTIAGAGRYPLAPGRWYVGVLNFSQQSAEVRLRASVLDEAPVVPIEVVYDDTSEACDVAPWTSERRAAMDEAARLLTEQLQPHAAIRIQACWESLGEGTLANAGAQYLLWADLGILSMPFLRERYTTYAAAAATQQAGTSFCHYAGGDCTENDIRANFNTTASFYYGLDRNGPANQANFITTAMHEITHGLGFFGRVDVETGEQYPLFVGGPPYRDIYGSHVRWHKLGAPEPLPLHGLSDAERAEAMVSGSGLRFHGPNLKQILGLELRLYAPATPNPGATYSHFDTQVLGNQLMAHRISANSPHDLGYALGVLYDVGWDPDHGVVPEPLLPRGGQFYDVSRSGHGIAMYRVAGTDNFYFLVFYTYDQAGLPEYYVSNGFLVDGVFVAERTENGDSLVRSLYQAGATPPGYHDADPAFEGLIRVDFNQATQSPACAGREAAAAVLSFTLPGSADQQWCLQPLADTSAAANDLTNVWLNFSDTGWGASSLSFAGSGGDGLGMQVYYPDGSGQPRWAIMQTGSYTPGESYPLMQARGYCRTCPSAPVTMDQVGTITVGLSSDAAGAGNPLEFEVTFDGPAAGTFSRDTEVVAGGDAGG